MVIASMVQLQFAIRQPRRLFRFLSRKKSHRTNHREQIPLRIKFTPTLRKSAVCIIGALKKVMDVGDASKSSNTLLIPSASSSDFRLKRSQQLYFATTGRQIDQRLHHAHTVLVNGCCWLGSREREARGEFS